MNVWLGRSIDLSKSDWEGACNDRLIDWSRDECIEGCVGRWIYFLSGSFIDRFMVIFNVSLID